jgi:hypothetical protein
MFERGIILWSAEWNRKLIPLLVEYHYLVLGEENIGVVRS